MFASLAKDFCSKFTIRGDAFVNVHLEMSKYDCNELVLPIGHLNILNETLVNLSAGTGASNKVKYLTWLYWL